MTKRLREKVVVCRALLGRMQILEIVSRGIFRSIANVILHNGNGYFVSALLNQFFLATNICLNGEQIGVRFAVSENGCQPARFADLRGHANRSKIPFAMGAKLLEIL